MSQVCFDVPNMEVTTRWSHFTSFETSLTIVGKYLLRCFSINKKHLIVRDHHITHLLMIIRVAVVVSNEISFILL